MKKMIVYGGLLFFLFVTLWWFSDIKNTYKSLPGSTSGVLKFPEFSSWIQYTPPSNLFSVSLPFVPQYAKETIDIPNSNESQTYTMFVSETYHDSMYLISQVSYSNGVDLSDQKNVLLTVIDEIRNLSNNNKTITSSEIRFQNQGGREFHFESPSKQSKGVAFMVDRTVFLLVYIAENEIFREESYQHFIGSFKLTR